MENLWIFYSLVGLISLWIADFIKKAVIMKWWNKDIFLFITYIFWVILFIINSFIQWEWYISSEIIIGASFLWLCTAILPVSLLITFKYLDTAFALTSIKVIVSILVLVIGVFLLWDQLSFLNIVWFLFWIIAIILFSWFSYTSKYCLHKKWILAMILAIIASVLGHSYFKYILWSVDTHTLLVLQFPISFLLISLYMFIRWKFFHFNKSTIWIIMPYAIPAWILWFIQWAYLMPNIYNLWPLSLWYKILSYSIIVTIILSAIFYKDPIDTKRIIAFVLTLISLALFII